MKHHTYVFEFPHWEIVEVSGPDAKDFLHRITSADFRNYLGNGPLSGTMLTALGKILFYFDAAPNARRDGYMLVSPRISESSAVVELEKLHFAENVTIRSARPEWRFFRVLTNLNDLPNLFDRQITMELNQWTVDHWPLELKYPDAPTRDFGVLTNEPNVTPQLASEDLSEYFRIASAFPASGLELDGSTIPLEAGLTKAVHENKGCYPGQEVIERIRSIGQTARVLGRIRGSGTRPTKGMNIFGDTDSAAVVATLTSSAQAPNSSQWVGLAYFSRLFAQGKKHAVGTLQNGAPVTIDFVDTGAKRA